MLSSPWLALLVTAALSLIWLRLMDFAALRGWISGPLSRKIIHIGTGPLFVLCWLLFPDQPISRYLAALVPLLTTAQFFLVGTGILNDPAAVKALSRTGDRREILRGPLIYGILFVLLTILYWKDSPIGLIGLMVMCGGDGLADVVGRRVPSLSIPWNPAKSLSGSLAMFLGGFIFSTLILGIFIAAGVFSGPLSSALLPLALISLAASLVESLPIRDIDNLTTTLTAVLLGHFFF
jgi:phytol kinase